MIQTQLGLSLSDADNHDDVQKQHQALCTLIADYDYAYYNLDAPTVPDSEYDRVFNALKALEVAHPNLVTPNSPTQRVGGSASNAFNSITHRQAMLSLNNVFDKIGRAHV